MVYVAYKLEGGKYTVPSTGVSVAFDGEAYFLLRDDSKPVQILEKPIIFNSLIESINWLSS